MSHNIVDTEDAQDATHEYITNFLIQNGYAPSMRDIQQGLQLGSVSTVRRLLHRLRSSGRIEYDDKLARSIRTVWE